MFNFMKLGIHFSPLLFNTIDPVVIEMIREERLAQAIDKHAAELAEARKFAAQDEQDTRKAA